MKNKTIVFGQAKDDDLELLINLRVEFITELKPNHTGDEYDKIYSDNKEYITRNFKNGTYIGFLGYRDGEVIATSALLLYELPPIYGNTNRLIGHVLNFYIKKEYRELGIGTKMIEYLKSEAKKIGVKRLFLNATKMGEKLYRKAGFNEPAETAMFLDI